MKKQILFVYDSMIMGGTTTSLLSILNNIDYDKYDVDLLLFRNKGPYFEMIPDKVNLLEQGYSPKGPSFLKPKHYKFLRAFFSGRLFRAVFLALKYKKIGHSNFTRAIWFSTVKYQLNLTRKLDKHYDAAIGSIENWPNHFVTSDLVDADKRICWVHPNYPSSYFLKEFDKPVFEKADKIVTVSEKCKTDFQSVFPSVADKTVCIENLLTGEFVNNKADSGEPVVIPDSGYINFVTVCRFDNNSKGLDRGLNAFKKLKNECITHNFRWYIIGNGPDYKSAKEFIAANQLDDTVFLLGSLKNPLPTERLMDCFILPSRYEGKPMAVTEALMLGLPCLVTEYSSAREQIEDGFNGLVLENNDDSLCYKLKELASDSSLLSVLKSNVPKKNYSNLEVIDKIYDII